tara:strand:+ start:5127 stop:5849 length:723 start_codon:yes stop_codon:yes gene_type:complete
MAASIYAHLQELRKRVFVCLLFTILYMIVSYIFYEPLYYFFSKPFLSLNLDTHPFYIRSILEGVFVKLKFSFLFGLVFSIPVYLFHILRFCLPGLKPTESRIILFSLIASFVFACLSFIYGYYLLLPLSIKFLMSYHFIPQDVGILLTYSDNLFIVFNLIAAIIVVFQLPVIVLLLLYFNIVTRSFLLRASRYIIVLAFILSAILTPPDVISQLLISIPLIFLFFLVIGLAKLFNWGTHV